MRRFRALIWVLCTGFGLYVLLILRGLGIACAFIISVLRTSRDHTTLAIALPNSREQAPELKGLGLPDARFAANESRAVTPLQLCRYAAGFVPGAWAKLPKTTDGIGFSRTKCRHLSKPTFVAGCPVAARHRYRKAKCHRIICCVPGSTIKLSRLPGDKMVSAGRSACPGWSML